MYLYSKTFFQNFFKGKNRCENEFEIKMHMQQKNMPLQLKEKNGYFPALLMLSVRNFQM